MSNFEKASTTWKATAAGLAASCISPISSFFLSIFEFCFVFSTDHFIFWWYYIITSHITCDFLYCFDLYNLQIKRRYKCSSFNVKFWESYLWTVTAARLSRVLYLTQFFLSLCQYLNNFIVLCFAFTWISNFEKAFPMYKQLLYILIMCLVQKYTLCKDDILYTLFSVHLEILLYVPSPFL